MFAAQFNRIFWKEWQVQKLFWVGCLMFEVVVLILFRTLKLPIFVFQVSVPCVGLYVVGCGALLFAREREMRTDQWLLSLSAPPAPLLCAKYGFAFVSICVLFIFTTALEAMFLSERFVSNLFRDQPRAIGHVVQHSGNLLMMFALLALSSLGSLTSRRTLVAIGALAVWWVIGLASVSLPLWVVVKRDWYFWPLKSPDEWVRLLIGVVVVVYVVVVGWLSLRWCRGKYIDGSLVEQLNQSESAWWNKQQWPALTLRRTYTDSSEDHSWGRSLQRLVWQERHRESLHILLLTVGVCSAPVTTLCYGLDDDHAVAGFAFEFTMLTIVAAPLLMGVLAFETDADAGQLRFLAGRGIWPRDLWFAKQVVWLTRAVWITALISVVALASESLLISVPNDPNVWGPAFRSTFHMLSTNPEIGIWFILSSFACGQFASTVFEKSVLAGVFGVILNVAACVWQTILLEARVPLGVGMGPLTLGLMLFTLIQMKPRMLECQTWTNRRHQLIGIVAIVIATFAFVLFYMATIRIMGHHGIRFGGDEEKIADH